MDEQMKRKSRQPYPRAPAAGGCEGIHRPLSPGGKLEGRREPPGACRGLSSPEVLGTSRLTTVVTFPSQLPLQHLQALLCKQA